MKSKIIHIVIILLSFTNCAKEGYVSIINNTQQLYYAKWHLDSTHVTATNSRIKELNTNKTLFPLLCEEDNYMVFNDTLSIVYNGKLKCNKNDSDSITQSYTLRYNELIWNNKQYAIRYLTSNALILYWDTTYSTERNAIKIISTQKFLYYYSHLK